MEFVGTIDFPVKHKLRVELFNINGLIYSKAVQEYGSYIRLV